MKKIFENIPLLSGTLIFIGFLNYWFYYDFFDIEINSYLTTGELLLSFLKLTIPILITFFVIFLFTTIPIYQIITSIQYIERKI